MPLKYRIKEFIEDKGQTREERAKLRLEIRLACGNLTPGQLSAWECYTTDDKHMIPADQLRKVARVLQCDINELFAERLELSVVVV